MMQKYGYALLFLVRRDFKARYSNTIGGLGWAVFHPVIQLLLYVFVFTFILKVKLHPGSQSSDFVLYLICGFLPYMALAEGIQRGSTSLVENRSLLEKVVFPAEVLPLVGVISSALTESIGLFLLVIIAFCFGISPSWWIFLLPILILMRVIFTAGMAWLTSVLNIFVSDLGQVLGLILMAWMFLTPIFYPESSIPQGLLILVKMNPLYLIIASYRSVLLYGQSPMQFLPGLVIWTTLISWAGIYFFSKTIDAAKDLI